MKTLLNKLRAAALAALLAITIAAPPISQIAATTASVAAQATAISAAAITVTALTSSEATATSMADYLENKIVDWFFRGQTFTAPATIYIGLDTVACNDAGGGTEVTGGTTSNNAAITFPTPTANWGTVVSFRKWDATTGGNTFFCAPLTINKTINNGDAAPSFAPAALTIQVDN